MIDYSIVRWRGKSIRQQGTVPSICLEIEKQAHSDNSERHRVNRGFEQVSAVKQYSELENQRTYIYNKPEVGSNRK